MAFTRGVAKDGIFRRPAATSIRPYARVRSTAGVKPEPKHSRDRGRCTHLRVFYRTQVRHRDSDHWVAVCMKTHEQNLEKREFTMSIKRFYVDSRPVSRRTVRSKIEILIHASSGGSVERVVHVREQRPVCLIRLTRWFALAVGRKRVRTRIACHGCGKISVGSDDEHFSGSFGRVSNLETLSPTTNRIRRVRIGEKIPLCAATSTANNKKITLPRGRHCRVCCRDNSVCATCAPGTVRV